MPGWNRALPLVGRERELSRLSAFTDGAAAGGGALVVVGEPGVGKTALLDATAGHAAGSGMRVLHASGVEFEAEVSFAALHQLLSPLFAELAALPTGQRRAIGVALGLETGPTPDRLALVNVLLTLLTGPSAVPVLLVVDDLQWLDRASGAVLATLARRLAGSTAGLIGVMRAGESSVFDEAGLDELTVGPLDDEAARELLTSAFPRLGPRKTSDVLAEAQGNPLALIELPTRTGTDAFEPTLARTPVGRRLRQHFARRIDALPAATRDQLLQAALDGTGDMFPPVPPADLEPAERSRLIHVHPSTRGVLFRHPLTRSAVVELSTADERRLAHQALAERHPPDSERRAWHLAAAAAGPDEKIALMLEEIALRTKGRGDPVGAISLLLRAADLSPAADDHHRRAMFATYLGTDVTGDLTSPQLPEAAPGIGSAQNVAAAVAAAAYMVNCGGDVDMIHRLLIRALHGVPRPVRAWDEPLAEIVYVLQANCSFASRADLIADYRAAVEHLGLALPAGLHLLGDTFLEPATRALPALPLLDAAIAGIEAQHDHAHAVRLGIAGLYVDRVPDCRTALWRVVDHGRAGGAIASAIKAFALLGFGSLLSGDWDGALRVAEEGLELTARHHYRLLGGFLQYDQAMIAAARGDDGTVRHITDDLIGWAAPGRVGFVLQLAAHARAMAELGRGDFASAYQHALEICTPTIPSFKPMALWVLFDLVEAAVRAGRYEEAADHASDIAAARVAEISPRLALVAAGAAALVSDDGFRTAFDSALAVPGADRWPFLEARIRLAYGERLRRAKAPGEARPHLILAADTFQRLGATPWTARAQSELRATGLTTPGAAGTTEPLTPQESEIAHLAASGLTNREIGERLFLSPRTIGAHLYRVFPKLGIASRSALRDALDQNSPSVR
jgi:DNA-binding CsgD family transcriptional regulator